MTPPPPPVSNKTGINPRGSEVDHDVCSEKNVDEQIHHEESPIVETRNVAQRAVGSPIKVDLTCGNCLLQVTVCVSRMIVQICLSFEEQMKRSWDVDQVPACDIAVCTSGGAMNAT